MVACCTINIISVILVTPPPGSELYVLRRKPCTIDSQSAHKQACLRLFAEILWYNFEGTTYDTRSRKSCLVFHVCGNYALMRVVHCGVLAARAYGSCMRWEVACTLRVSIKILRTRDHREGCIAFSYNVYPILCVKYCPKKNPSLAVWRWLLLSDNSYYSNIAYRNKTYQARKHRSNILHGHTTGVVHVCCHV